MVGFQGFSSVHRRFLYCLTFIVAAVGNAALSQGLDERQRARIVCFWSEIGGDFKKANENFVVIAEQNEESHLDASYYVRGGPNYHTVHNTDKSLFDVYVFEDVELLLGVGSSSLSTEALAERLLAHEPSWKHEGVWGIRSLHQVKIKVPGGHFVHNRKTPLLMDYLVNDGERKEWFSLACRDPYAF